MAKQDAGGQRVAVMQRAARAVLALAAVCLAATALAQDQASAGADTARFQAMNVEAAESERDDRHRSIDREVQALKKEVLDLNRDLFLLEEELLFPANSQVAFFVSMDVGEYFELDSVNIRIDGKEVANYLYTERETDALIRGGVHRIHMANLKTGTHELIAVFTGKGPQFRDYRRGATLRFDKGIGSKYVELEITDRVRKQQPEFAIKEWE